MSASATLHRLVATQHDGDPTHPLAADEAHFYARLVGLDGDNRGDAGLKEIHRNRPSANETPIFFFGHAVGIARHPLDEFAIELVQTAHAAIANARAHIDQRLARWILMAHDRTGDNALPLTHGMIPDNSANIDRAASSWL